MYVNNVVIIDLYSWLFVVAILDFGLVGMFMVASIVHVLLNIVSDMNKYV